MDTGAEWGGQNELHALSQALKRQIKIIQINAVVVKIGEEFTSLPPLSLSYHRHAYALGEHYK